MTDRDDESSLNELNKEADIAADYLEGLLDVLDFDGDIEMGVRDGRPIVQIVADDDTDIRTLIGHNGHVVEALQRLTRLAVEERIGRRSRLILDVDGYLTRRRRHLREEALDAIDEVNDTGRPVTLEDMNSYERKIVHDIARDEGMRSRSHGEEPHRHVTIYLSKADRDETWDEGNGENLDEEMEGSEENFNGSPTDARKDHREPVAEEDELSTSEDDPEGLDNEDEDEDFDDSDNRQNEHEDDERDRRRAGDRG